MELDLQSEVKMLRDRVDQLEARSGLMSPNWFKRAFTVLVYTFVAGSLFYLCVTVAIFLLALITG